MPSLQPYDSSLDYSYAPGIFPSMECLLYRPGSVRRLLLHSGSAGREGISRLISLAEACHVRVEEADRALSRVSGKENCWTAAVFAKFQDTLLPSVPHVVLHNPGDSGNVGTILRTALGLGIEDIALIRPCADPFEPRTVRASMGSIFSLRLRLYDTFDEYRNDFPGHVLYPFMLDASRPLAEVLRGKPDTPWTLVFGNEGRGLPREFAALGRPVRIESNDRIDSLNLAVAAAIGIYGFTGM